MGKKIRLTLTYREKLDVFQLDAILFLMQIGLRKSYLAGNCSINLHKDQQTSRSIIKHLCSIKHYVILIDDWNETEMKR